MDEGAPSRTAQHVAVYRLGFQRLLAPFGDASADERLARDLAGSKEFTRSENMARYLQGRTSFFDRAVVNGLEREVTQVAAIGAGYDLRSLRYAKPGVRWFEVDHPSTQADKRLRLERLEIDVSHISFVATDLADGGVGSALLQCGWDPDAASLMLCEGLAVYLDESVLDALLKDLRALASVGTRLALSSTPPATDPDQAGRRASFRAAIAGLGEPAGNALSSDDFAQMLTDARWRAVEISERSKRAGFAVAAPAWEPAADGASASASRVGRYL
jgi:methyltransferase (TIGR00027 family)